MALRLIVVLSVATLCGTAALWCEDRDKDEVTLSATRPLLLAEIPAYLDQSPLVDQAGGTLTVQYLPTAADGPSVCMQQFNAPQLAGFPERPPFEEMPQEEDESDERLGYFAPWRCGELGLSTLVTWETDPGEATREDILAELADLFESACANPSTVPTPPVDLVQVEDPQVPTCTADELNSLIKVTAENQGSEKVNVRVWSDPEQTTIQVGTVEPGQSETWELDVAEFAQGLEFAMESEPDNEKGYVLGIGLNGRDKNVVLTGPPLRFEESGDFYDQNCIDL